MMMRLALKCTEAEHLMCYNQGCTKYRISVLGQKQKQKCSISHPSTNSSAVLFYQLKMHHSTCCTKYKYKKIFGSALTTTQRQWQYMYLLSLAVAIRARLLSRNRANSAVYESSCTGSLSSAELESCTPSYKTYSYRLQYCSHQYHARHKMMCDLKRTLSVTSCNIYLLCIQLKNF